MRCRCLQTPKRLYRDELGSAFMASLTPAASGNWRALFRCSACGALWAIDEYDKYTDAVVVQVNDESDWEESAMVGGKQLFLERRGGAASGRCIQAGCSNRPVKGFVLCVEHLWADGWRR